MNVRDFKVRVLGEIADVPRGISNETKVDYRLEGLKYFSAGCR